MHVWLFRYGQAAQVLDRVSLTVVSTEADEEFVYDAEEMENLIGQTLDLFVVVYDNTSQESHRWDNDTGEIVDIFGPDVYMTFISDGSYLLGRDLLSIFNIFNYSPPSYPNVRQVYNDTYYDGYPLVTEENPGTTYDYQIQEGLLGGVSAGCLFNYYPNVGWARGSIHFKDDQGHTATVSFEGDQDSVQRVIIRRPALPAKAKAPNPLPIGGIR